MSLLQARQLKYQYSGQEPLFQDAVFDINPGDRIGLVGPNGGGKTTLLRILNDELDPDAGTVIRRRVVCGPRAMAFDLDTRTGSQSEARPGTDRRCHPALRTDARAPRAAGLSETGLGHSWRVRPAYPRIRDGGAGAGTDRRLPRIPVRWTAGRRTANDAVAWGARTFSLAHSVGRLIGRYRTKWHSLLGSHP